MTRLLPALFLSSCAWLAAAPTHQSFTFDLAGNLLRKQTPQLPPQVANRMLAGGGPFSVGMPIAIVFEEEFPEENLVMEAAEWWNKRLGRQVFVDGRFADGGSVVYVEFSWDSVVDSDGNTGTYELAVTRTGLPLGGQVIFHDVVFYASWLAAQTGVQRSTIRHELAHVIGMDHSNKQDCLMFWQVQEHEDGSPTGLCPEEKSLAYQLMREGFRIAPEN